MTWLWGNPMNYIDQSVRSAVAFGLHETGDLLKLTFQVHQSISGLFSTSHMCPRMMVVQPMPVMWKVAFLNDPHTVL